MAYPGPSRQYPNNGRGAPPQGRERPRYPVGNGGVPNPTTQPGNPPNKGSYPPKPNRYRNSQGEWGNRRPSDEVGMGDEKRRPKGNFLKNFVPRSDESGLAVFLRYLLLGVAAVLAAMFFVKLIMVVTSGIGPMIQAFIEMMNLLVERVIAALISAAVVYLLIMMFIKKYIPYGIQRKMFPIVFGVIMLYSISPVLSTAIGELLFMLLGFAILWSVLKH